MNDEIRYHEENIAKYEKIISELTDEEQIKGYRMLIKANQTAIENIDKKSPSIDSCFLPEYREDGYFNSPEFKEIEKKVDEEILNLGLTIQNEINIIKQEILKNQYGIDWLPFEKRFMPGTIVNID